MSKALRGLALLAPVALVACGKGGVFASTPDSLRYEMRSVEKSDGECRSTDSLRTPSPCVKVAISWPQLADSTGSAGEAQRFIRRLAAASFKNGADKGSPDSVVAEVLAGHTEMKTKHGTYDEPWTTERQITVACNEPGRLGVKVYTNQFTGGSHAASATRYTNFDTKTGKRSGLPELVIPGKELALKEAMLSAFQKTKRVPVKIPLDSFPEPASVLACGDSLVMQYDLVLMGPHQMIGNAIVVKRTDLEGIVRP
jgi:hypothetical protein